MTPEQENVTAQLSLSREELDKLIRNIYKEESAAEKAGKKIMSKDAMRTALLELPKKEVLRDYETTVAKKYADKWAEASIRGELVELIDLIKEAPAYQSPDWYVAFGAFAVAVNFERLNKNHSKEKELLDTYRPYFEKEHPFFLHLDVLYRMDLVDEMDARIPDEAEFLKKLLQDAMQNSENLAADSASNGNFGGYHAFAELTAHLFECSFEPLHDFLTDPTSKWLEHARDAATMAIASDRNYAKYYCTYGRVLAQMGELDEAIYNVSIAIDKEDHSRTNYAMRVMEYKSYYQQFRSQQKMEEQKKAIDEKVLEVTLQMEAQEKESMAKNMEFLGLFSGIVSFTIGSLTITGAIANQSIMKAAGLIVVLLGALMCVFAAFGMILHGFHNIRKDQKSQKYTKSFMYRHLVVFGLGALVVAGGIVLCLFV